MRLARSALAAAVMGIPVAVVEPNSVMGLSNRVIAPLARRIYLAFERSCRRAFARDEDQALRCARSRIGFTPRASVRSSARRVLVLGGSQGAQALNERVPEALGAAGRRRKPLGIEVVHQAGEGRDAAVREAYARFGLKNARVVPFSTDMSDDLAWADLVVARAGAGTIAEIAAVGRASLVIPYPHAADDHQAKNAAAYARGRRCRLARAGSGRRDASLAEIGDGSSRTRYVANGLAARARCRAGGPKRPRTIARRPPRARHGGGELDVPWTRSSSAFRRHRRHRNERARGDPPHSRVRRIRVRSEAERHHSKARAARGRGASRSPRRQREGGRRRRVLQRHPARPTRRSRGPARSRSPSSPGPRCSRS